MREVYLIIVNVQNKLLIIYLERFCCTEQIDANYYT